MKTEEEIKAMITKLEIDIAESTESLTNELAKGYANGSFILRAYFRFDRLATISKVALLKWVLS